MGKIQLFDFRNFFKGYPLFLQELYKKNTGEKFFSPVQFARQAPRPGR